MMAAKSRSNAITRIAGRQRRDIDVPLLDRRDQHGRGKGKLRPIALDEACSRTAYRYNQVELSVGKETTQISDERSVVLGIAVTRGLQGGLVQIDLVRRCLTSCSRNSPENSLNGKKSRPNECKMSTRFVSAAALLTATMSMKMAPIRAVSCLTPDGTTCPVFASGLRCGEQSHICAVEALVGPKADA